MMKKFLACLLVAGMMAGLALSAFADTTSRVQEQSSENASQGNALQGQSLGSVSGNGKANPPMIAGSQSAKTLTDNSLQLGGAKITMIRGRETGQQLCIVIQSPEGKLIVVDGGLKTNAPYLGEFINQRGGTVAAWLLTHPHIDHVGALEVILEQQQKKNEMQGWANINIENIFYGMMDESYYREHEPAYRMPVIKELLDDFSQFDQSRLHPNSPAGTAFDIGSVHVEILNPAYAFPVDTGNNGSVCYKITVNGKSLITLGDLGYQGSLQLVKDRSATDLKADIVTTAHHGEHGGCPELYRAIHPSYVLWPTSKELWDKSSLPYPEDESVYTISLTKHWIDAMNPIRQYVMMDGDWELS